MAHCFGRQHPVQTFLVFRLWLTGACTNGSQLPRSPPSTSVTQKASVLINSLDYCLKLPSESGGGAWTKLKSVMGMPGPVSKPTVQHCSRP